MSKRLLCLAALLAGIQAGPALAEPPTVKTTFDLRLRGEGWDAPARNTTTDSSYQFGLARARVGLDLTWERWTLHGMIQSNGIAGLPDNGSFGAGPTYVAANGSDTSLAAVGLAELSAIYQREGLRLVLGRQAFGEGFEVPTGVPHLDRIKRARLGERL
ncbi:MAG TPA: hypothetical protein VJ885_07155, partial [Thermoanaerobaculia bacterium]|nr:hypothetical protein [Thermoanaerobaculia bacterium]